MRELVYYVAVSLDGYIAGPDGSFDAFLAEGDHMEEVCGRFADALPTVAAQHLGVDQRRDTFDTVVMGWNTYAVGLPYGMNSPYQHLDQIVFSRRHRAEDQSLACTDRSPVEVVRELKAREGSGIWLCGGGHLAGQLVDEIDRLILKRNPVVFGSGIPLYGRPDSSAYAARRFDPVAEQHYDSGVTISEFVRTRD